MMTFLPFASFAESARSLDMRRLQNQRTEARFVLEWLERSGPYFDMSDYGAARMWQGFRDALAMYYNAMLEEYERRGKTNGPTLPRAKVPATVQMPPWVGDERFHSSHRAVLIQKDPVFYGQHGWAEADLDAVEFREYLYPHIMADGRWGLYPQSKYKHRTCIAVVHGGRLDGAPSSAESNGVKRELTAEAISDGEDKTLATRASKRKRGKASATVPGTPSTAEVMTAPAACTAETHATLSAEYMRLTKEVLPKVAASEKYPIRFDHCFQRVALDHAYGDCWYNHLDRKKGPAIKQIGVAALRKAVAVARRMATEGIETVRGLDEQSLRWK